MRLHSCLRRVTTLSTLALVAAHPMPAAAAQYSDFAVAIYLPVQTVRRLDDPAVAEREWAVISSQLKVDKVYIESYRDRVMADDATLDRVKQFFVARGVATSGGITFTGGNIGGQWQSLCYTDAADRALAKSISELTARHFDQIVLDDFFFVTTKNDSDIAAKGTRSWTDFRLDLMTEAGKSLVIDPAKAVNPKVKVVIKYPNWYEHFQGLGFDLDRGPKLFDGIYTGTETRDPNTTDQFLQQYLSYQIYRYFENIRPGGNGGGWVDTFAVRYVDRYAEQLWDTMFAKAPEMTLFYWDALLQPIEPGERAGWEHLPTSFNYAELLRAHQAAAAPVAPAPTMARAAGYALEQVDGVVGKLGRPIGVKCYRPPHALGEDFLQNFVGMLGVPIDMYPAFPSDADVVLLTASAAHDPEIIARIKGQLSGGKSVVITSGLLQALQGKGIEDIVEARCLDRRVIADGYTAAFGFGDRTVTPAAAPAVFPQVQFLTNDSWALVSAMSDGLGYPLLLMNRYSKGVLYIWTIPDNFHHLYRLPASVLAQLKNVLMRDFFVRLDGPSQVALFAYDNHTFVLHSYLDSPADMKVGLLPGFSRIRDLTTGEVLAGAPPAETGPRWRRSAPEVLRTTVGVHVQPHSYRVFSAER